MSVLQRFALFAILIVMGLSSGCCTIGGYGSGCGGCASIPPAPGCGLPAHVGCGTETYYCDGCSDRGCAGCGDGPVIPCGPYKAPTSCLSLGLGCIGSLLGLDGCGGCGGCGETYYHEWINDPPYCDPCDGCGGWTGVPGPGTLGSCNSGCTGCAAACGPEPSCGSSASFAHGVYVGRSIFELPGRALFATWTGFGGLARELRRGLIPSPGTCNAFTSGGCDGCASPGCGMAPTCGAPAHVYPNNVGGCSTCNTTPVATVSQVAQQPLPPATDRFWPNHQGDCHITLWEVKCDSPTVDRLTKLSPIA